MKFKCSGYSPQSSICNCDKKKCPLAVIETDGTSRCEVRCPRKPFLVKGGYYVNHKQRVL